MAAKRKVSTSQKKLLGNKRAELNRPVCKWLKAQGQLLGWDASSESLALIMGIFTNLSTGDVAGFLNHPPSKSNPIGPKGGYVLSRKAKESSGIFVLHPAPRPQWCIGTQCGGDDSKFHKGLPNCGHVHEIGGGESSSLRHALYIHFLYASKPFN